MEQDLVARNRKRFTFWECIGLDGHDSMPRREGRGQSKAFSSFINGGPFLPGHGFSALPTH